LVEQETLEMVLMDKMKREGQVIGWRVGPVMVETVELAAAVAGRGS
jgi:hypothetical protein